MSHATRPPGRTPKPPKRRNPRYQLRTWRCGLCNTLCPTVLAPGGLCSVCRRQPRLPGVDELPGLTVDAQWFIPDSSRTDKRIGYLCKYLTKSIAETYDPDSMSARQRRHLERLHREVRGEQ